ncbi:hypothetical protein BCON_0821g00020 [Botryotinia convoluta]|uniref:Uncharacterized protein n=1 Tax=Botryotinia convoluta TaxID=54673 RepID=A0A4Z1HAS6_9HELO|nr:hypothetical protein BCON_0821g00020 [Botryotinia convoluta]
MSIRKDLEDNIKLEKDYQDLIEKDSKPGHRRLSEEEKKNLKIIDEDFKKIKKNERREINLCLPLQTNLENWSDKHGTRTKKASDIMKDYKDLAGNKVLKERNKEEQKKEKKRLDAMKKKGR